jgi:L-alanine-DL-glutamate epimerase-like enolase superfamily enzyme
LWRKSRKVNWRICIKGSIEYIMEIKDSRCLAKTLRLKEPYSIAYESVDKVDNIFLSLSTSNGYHGWGCAAPVKSITNESTQDVLDSFTNTIEPFLKGEDVFRYVYLMENLKKQIPGKPSALAMVDMALHDLLSQKAGVPLFKFLGGYRLSIPTSITIGIMPISDTLAHAKSHVKRGFKILKIKGGKNVSEDIEKINRIRETVGRQIKIRFDANQGYTVDDSIKFIKGTHHTAIELFEQPTPKSHLEQLAQVANKTSIPVMADESLLTLKDVFRLSKGHYTDLINIKLMKTGGILEGMHVNSVAKAAGIHAMVGCMDESALGIAAGLHFALSRPNIKYADLDGHFDIINDPFEGLLKIQKGVLIPPAAIGLGWIGLKNISL